MDAELISYLDAKFGAIDAKFGELRAEIDVRFGELRAEIDARFNEERIERRAEIEKTETNLLRAFHNCAPHGNPRPRVGHKGCGIRSAPCLY